jgi:uncharacterized protein YkwD
VKKFAGIIAAAIIGSIFSAGTASAATASLTAADNSCYTYKTSERSFAKKNNTARANAGIGKLSLDPELSRVAKLHTKEMANADDLFHSTSTQLTRRVTGGWTLLGENVGVGSSVSSLHSAFMNSPLHKANMMNANFKHVGVGTITKGDRMWVTVIFSAGSDPGTSLSMPNC